MEEAGSKGTRGSKNDLFLPSEIHSLGEIVMGTLYNLLPLNRSLLATCQLLIKSKILSWPLGDCHNLYEVFSAHLTLFHLSYIHAHKGILASLSSSLHSP